MISKVEGHNFLSWKDLSYGITPGVTIIDGWNEDDGTPEGSGKSAILNLICWTIYGKIPKDANIDDVIKEGEKTCEGTVSFSDGMQVHRSRKPNELLMAYRDKIIKGKDAKETQVLIEEYVGLSFETFCQTVYFAQNYTKKFITSNQEEKGKILSEVQDLVVFDKSGKEVRSLIKLEEEALVKLKHSINLSTKDAELTKRDVSMQEAAHEHARQQQAQRINNLNNQIAAQEASHSKALEQQMARVHDLSSQAADTEKLMSEYQASKDQLLSTASTLVYDEQLEKSFQAKNNSLMSDAGAINAELTGIDRLVVKRANAEAQGKRYAARYKQIQQDKDKNLTFIANPTKNCPTCNSKLGDCDTSHAQAEVIRLDEESASILETLNILSAEIDVPVPTKEELNFKLDEIRNQRALNEIEIQKIRAVKDKMNSMAVHLTSLDQNIKTQGLRLVKIQSSIAVESQPLIVDHGPLNALRKSLAIESAPLTFDTLPLETLQIKLNNIQSNLQDLNNLILEKNTYLRRLEDLKIGFKEIKSYVFNSMLNEINARVQKYLSHLFEVPVSVRFKNEDMKIETNVKYDGVDRGLGLLSGGQFRRVSLAVDLALSDVITSRKGAKVGVLVLDEYFKDLSEPSMEKCLTLLEGRGQPVLLIEHNSIFKNIVNNSLFVRLQDGTSHVEV